MLRPLFAAISRTFFRGLAVVLPVAITAYVLYWLVATAEASLGPLLRAVLPGVLYFPGLGVVAGLVLVFAVGILMRIWLLRQVITLFERLLEKLPLVKTLFGSVKDLMGLFGGSERRGLDQVVWVSLADGAAQVIGFVTRDDLDGLVPPEQAGDRIAVYLPMSYQIGGFTLLVPRSAVTATELSVEEGMRFAMTAGVRSMPARD